jgi:hypothetical protein
MMPVLAQPPQVLVQACQQQQQQQQQQEQQWGLVEGKREAVGTVMRREG